VPGELIGPVPEQRHVRRVDLGQRGHQLTLRAVAPQQVRHAHPVERRHRRHARHVQIRVHVEVDDPGARRLTGERAEPNRAVAAEHERAALHRAHPRGGLADHLHHLRQVLREAALAIGPETADGGLAAVVHGNPAVPQQVDEARVA
jgi:hypothetical protein